METAEDKQVVVVGVDENEHSLYALSWTIDHLIVPFLPDPPIRVVIINARPSPVTVLGGVGPGSAVVLPIVEADLKKVSALVIEKAKRICNSKSVHDVAFGVVEGDARNVLCDAVERHRASILVVGSHSYGALKRAFLGSVSDYCVHHASCSVLIMKRTEK